MTPTKRQGWRGSRALRVSGVALLLLAGGCSNMTSGDPAISADAERNSSGRLEALKVEGKRFAANGQVLITMLMAAGPGNASPYFEETIQADNDGRIKYEKRPVPCPQTGDYGQGSWVTVTARDMTGGISSSKVISPGREPDCRA